MVQVVEHLPSKWEVLSLSPNTVKKKGINNFKKDSNKQTNEVRKSIQNLSEKFNNLGKKINNEMEIMRKIQMEILEMKAQ
jgi:hypothetical protein